MISKEKENNIYRTIKLLRLPIYQIRVKVVNTSEIILSLKCISHKTGGHLGREVKYNKNI